MSHASTSVFAAVAALCSLAVVACGPAASTDPSTDPAPVEHAPDGTGPSASSPDQRVAPNATPGAAHATPIEPTQTAPHPTGVVHAVQVTNGGYSPTSMTISLGDSVDFVFADDNQSVTSGFECLADGMFQSGRREAGETYRVTFLRTGVFPFFSEGDCSRITGALLVKN